jgi:hypothetical protein
MSNQTQNLRYSGYLIAFFIGILLSVGIMFSQRSIAQSSPSVFTGSCGMLVNRNFGGWEAHYLGDTTIAQNFIGIINFDTKKINIAFSTVSAFGQPEAVAAMSNMTNIDFTISNGPFTGSYYISNGSDKWFTIIPVNGGNTFLFVENNNQAVATGMCQKI